VLFDFDALCIRPELPLVEPEVEPIVEPEVLIEPEPDVLPIEPEPEPEVLPMEPELEVVEPEVLPEVEPIEPEVLPLVEPDVLPPVVLPLVLPVVVWAKAVPEVRAKPQTKAIAWSGNKMCFFIIKGERGKGTRLSC
jgi:hypothetical protein